MNRKEKQQARAERYEELARKAETQSTQAWEKSHEMVSHIPMGQPILVGHHSERGHRRLLDRSWNKMGEECKTRRKGRLLPAKSGSGGEQRCDLHRG